MILYIVSLCVFVSMALTMRRAAMARTGIAIALNWICGVAWVRATGDYSPAIAWTLIDFGAAMVILMRPAGRMQAAVGAVFLAEIVAHMLYYIAAHPGENYYLGVLDVLADVQLVLYAAWVGGVGVRGIGNRWRGRHRKHHLASHPAGMVQR